MSEQTTFLGAPFEYKFVNGNAGSEGTFEGYGAAFNNIDDGGDRILPGSFNDTLASYKSANRMPKMLLNHGGMASLFGGSNPKALLPIGKWDAMSEDSRGLQVKGHLFLDTTQGKDIYVPMREGELDELSIGYKADKFVRGTRKGEPARTISTLKLIEVSPVTFGMNTLAKIQAVKTASKLKTIREFEDFLRDVGGFSNAAAKAIAASGYKASLPEPRDEDGIGEAIAGEFGRLAKLIRS